MNLDASLLLYGVVALLALELAHQLLRIVRHPRIRQRLVGNVLGVEALLESVRVQRQVEVAASNADPNQAIREGTRLLEIADQIVASSGQRGADRKALLEAAAAYMQIADTWMRLGASNGASDAMSAGVYGRVGRAWLKVSGLEKEKAEAHLAASRAVSAYRQALRRVEAAGTVRDRATIQVGLADSLAYLGCIRRERSPLSEALSWYQSALETLGDDAESVLKDAVRRKFKSATVLLDRMFPQDFTVEWESGALVSETSGIAEATADYPQRVVA